MNITKEKKKKSILKLEGFQIYTDSEWTSDNTPVSVQVLITHPNGYEARFIVLNEKYKNNLNSELIQNWSSRSQTDVLYYPLDDDFNVIHTLLKEYYLREVEEENLSNYYFSGEVYMFYSFQDLGFALGWNNIEQQLKKEINSKSVQKIAQKRSITGVLKIEDDATCRQNRWRVRDLSGLTNTSLKEFASSLGIAMEDKDKLDHLKSCMDQALIQHTNLFLDYGLGDVLVLKQIKENFLTLVNRILAETLGMPEKHLYSDSTLPMTTGSLVAQTFEKFLFYHAQKKSQHLYFNFVKKMNIETLPEKKVGSNTAFYLALWCLSFLKRTHSKREEYLLIYKDLFDSKNLDTIFQKSLDHAETLSKWVFSPPFDSYPYSSASIETLATHDVRTTSLLNCLVSGGRANNELPSEYTVKHVLDVDLQSCYGTALTSFNYPIGLPTILAFAPNEKKISLKEFLNKYESELVPGLYKITVSGKLSFNQDLLYSKVTTYAKMFETISNFNKKFEGENEDVVHFANDFVLSRRECLNTVLTHDLINVIKKVATNTELADFLNLEVETALFWKKSDRCWSCSEWITGVLKNPGEVVFNEKNQAVYDTRSRLWYALPINDFLGKLVAQRNQLKALSKTEGDPSEKQRLKGLQNILKLFINTLYGCLASPYFSIGNVVLADNITGRARVNVWMLCKSLNLRQSITDGGIYTPESVNSFKTNVQIKKPGFHTLSDIRILQKHRSIKTGPLCNLEWSKYYQEGMMMEELRNIDEMVYEHVNNFWDVYGLKLTIGIEHKKENTAAFGVYTGKANYALKVYDSESKMFNKKYFRLRGAKLDDGEYYPVVYALHDQLLDGIDIIKLNTSNKTKRLLRLGTWCILQRSPTTDDVVKRIRPGQAVEQTVHFVFRDSHYGVPNIKVFLSKKRKNFTSPLYQLKPLEGYSQLHKRITEINELLMTYQMED